MKPSLIAYLKSDWFIETSLAIDFTLSNLDISNLRSLHKIDPLRPQDMNMYEKAMFEVCKVLQRYSKNGQFAVYGFGGIPLYTDEDGVILPHEKEELMNPLKNDGKKEKKKKSARSKSKPPPETKMLT